jgi:lipoate-protein ligase A
MLPALRLVHLHTCAARVPILLQLQLEEALLRSDGGNWAVLNVGAEPPAVVMGLSGKLHRLVNVQEAQRSVRGRQWRGSGGGEGMPSSGAISSHCGSVPLTNVLR